MEAEPSGEPVRTALVPVGGAADNLIRFFFPAERKTSLGSSDDDATNGSIGSTHRRS